MSKFHRFGVEKLVWLPACNSLAAPTRGEINAGVVIVDPGVRTAEALNEADGWERRTSFIDTPDAATDFNAKITGRTEAGDPKVTIYDDDESNIIRTALAEGSEGFMLRMPYGDVPGADAEVFPATSGSVVRSQLNSNNEAATYDVMFAITAAPETNAVVPAL